MVKRFLYILICGMILNGLYEFSFAQGKVGKTSLENNEDQCLTCHKDIDMLPEGYSENDIHRYAGFACSSCHGGDPTSSDQEVAMSPAKGFIGVPQRKDIPKLCGKCHSNIDIMRVYQPRIATDQVSQYFTSVHGKKLQAGDENVAECASCHTAHSILSANDPRSSVYALNVPGTCNKCHGNSDLMSKYSLSTNQLEEYTKSVHGIALLDNHDLGAPACNDCHGNHGATPPGITSITHVCGTCHASNMEFFNETRMAKAFEELDYHGCEQCHGNHGVKKPNDNMVGVGKESTCTECHSDGDEGYVAAEKLENSLVKLRTRYDQTYIKYLEVRQKGMNDVDIGFLLQDAKQALIQSRTLIHTFDTVKVGNKTKEGMDITNKATQMAQNQIDEYYTRRNGFAAATLVFLIIIVALYFKIKDREKKIS